MVVRAPSPASTCLTASWVTALFVCSNCSSDSDSADNGPLSYVDVTAESGVDFTHEHGGSGEMYFVETNGSGAGFFDYDDDGDMDLYVVQAGALPGFEGEGPFIDRLFANDGSGHFSDVTEAAGLGHTGYGMGCVMADYDGDGARDLYVYNWGPNVLYRNRGDGTFENVTSKAGVGDRGYGGAAVFADFDGDGDLDLYVGNYVEFDLATAQPCAKPPAERSYCHPDNYAAQRDVLYRNRGDGTFVECAVQSGITRDDGKALGALACDYDDDGDLDLFVANDSSANHAYRNDSTDGTLRFTDVSEATGFSYDRDGRTQGSMGISAADIDGDLDLDLVVTNFAVEANALYIQQDDGRFEDEAYPRGIGRTSYLDFGWGIRFVDFDRDMDQDLLVINGHLHDQVDVHDAVQEYAQSPRLFSNDGQGRFTELKDAAGPFFADKVVGRGLAMADIDNDGDLDFFVATNDHSTRLVRCTGQEHPSWIGIHLQGPAPNRDAIGARVSVVADGVTQRLEVRAGASFASQHDPRLLFGLRDLDRADVEVRWPDGTITTHAGLEAGQYHALAKMRP